MSAHRGRVAARLLALLVLVLAPVACGIPEESEPRAISPERIPDPLRGEQDADEQEVNELGRPGNVWLVRTDPVTDDRSIAAKASVFEVHTPQAYIQQLLDTRGVVLRDEPNLQNLIPPELTVDYRETTADDGTTTAILTLSDAWSTGPPEGENQVLAVAQLVFTATELGTVDQVRFRDDQGDPLPVPDGNGAEKDVVTRDDYQNKVFEE